MKRTRRQEQKRERMIRIQVQVPPSYKAALDALRAEGYTASAYLRRLLENDLKAREEAGWEPGKGWPGRMQTGGEMSTKEVRQMKRRDARKRGKA